MTYKQSRPSERRPAVSVKICLMPTYCTSSLLLSSLIYSSASYSVKSSCLQLFCEDHVALKSHFSFPRRDLFFIALSWFPLRVTILSYFYRFMTNSYSLSHTFHYYMFLALYDVCKQMSWNEEFTFLAESFNGKGRTFYKICHVKERQKIND